MIKRIVPSIVSVLAGLILGATSLSASFVSGQFDPSGTTMRMTRNEILFYSLPGFIPPICPPGACNPTGNFVVLPPVTGSFVGRQGETGTIKNLTRSSADQPTLAFSPTDSNLTVMNFVVLAAGPSITFELTRLASGRVASGMTAPVCDPAHTNEAGYQCITDVTSPLLLTNVQTSPGGAINTNIAISATGLAWFSATPAEKSNAVFSFITSKANLTIAGVLGEMSGSTGYTESALSGAIVVTPTPESTTLVLSGTALAVIALLSLRKSEDTRTRMAVRREPQTTQTIAVSSVSEGA